jgi:hypothetical protein
MQLLHNIGIRFFALLSTKSSIQNLTILLIAALICFPCFFRGIPGGYDSRTHVNYQNQFSRQFWSGDIYPRWLAEANKGYGSPIFVIQYPLPYFLTALIRPLTFFPVTSSREARELGIFIFFVLASSGVAMRFWLVKIANPLSATLAAVVYMSLPYLLVGIYMRAAIGELCALVWMPLLLALCESMHENMISTISFGAAFALLILSNILIAALFTPILIVYTLVTGQQKNVSLKRNIGSLLLGGSLGTGMAGIYLLPVIAHQRLFDIGGLRSNLADFELGRYFLYLTSGSLHSLPVLIGMAVAICVAFVSGWCVWYHGRQKFIWITMVVTLALGLLILIPDLGPLFIGFSGLSVSSFNSLDYFSVRMMLTLFSTMALGLIAYCSCLPEQRSHREKMLLLITCSTFILMLPFSAPIWAALPALEKVQFPFRLGGILSLAVTGLIALAFDSYFVKPIISRPRPSLFIFCIMLVLLIGGGALTWRIDWLILNPRTIHYQHTRDVDLMYRTYVAPEQLHGFARLLGTEPNSYDSKPTIEICSSSAKLISGQCNISMTHESPRALLITADCREESHLRISQLYFPLWGVMPVQGAYKTVVGVSQEGLIELSMLPGRQVLRLMFDGGASEQWGVILTILSLLIALILYAIFTLRGKYKLKSGASHSEKL